MRGSSWFMLAVSVLTLSLGLAARGSANGVADFLTPDGSFDLEAARTMGFEGAIELDGFAGRIDPRSGRPVFAMSGDGNPEIAAGGSWWDGVGSPDPRPGLERYVFCMAVWNQDLVVGGCFTEAGGVPVNAIARWD